VVIGGRKRREGRGEGFGVREKEEKRGGREGGGSESCLLRRWVSICRKSKKHSSNTTFTYDEG